MLCYTLLYMDTITQWFEHDGIAIVFILIGGAILYFVGGKLIEFFTKQLVRGKGRTMPRKDVEKRQKTLASLTGTIWRSAIVIVAALSIFRQLFPGLDLSPLFASAGIVGIAVAFGSQAIVKDFLTGLFIVTENQYRVGDVVEINGAEGKVEHLGTRSTIIRDTDGNVHYIPNGTITRVVNKTMGYSRVNFTLSLASGADFDKAVSTINQVGDQLAADKEWKSKVIEAPQFYSIETFSGSAVTVTVNGKVQPSDQWRVTAEMRRRLLEEFEKNKIPLA